ncbi:MAG: hypothetical protein KDD44_11820 [Bdellovibrionales bacterium]|nr:hypothetical protein [Bdellovibrionales bacterium]
MKHASVGFDGFSPGRGRVETGDRGGGAEPTEVSGSQFDPNEKELVTGWASYASNAVCINTYPNGITISVHDDLFRPGETVSEARSIRPHQFYLRLKDTKEYQLPHGRYYLYREHYREALERRLQQLHEQGILKSSVVYFGTISDPFSSFHKKFDITMSCLELLEHYRPERVVVQTRSPMVISALPVLKSLGEAGVVGIPIESRLERALLRYAPGLPKLGERLIAADGLRKQGITVNLVASPILPYGDMYRDAWDFAALLDAHADYISVGCLAGSRAEEEHRLKSLPVVKKLVADKQYRCLRPHAYRHVYFALKVLAPEKLVLPVRDRRGPRQLAMFAA